MTLRISRRRLARYYATSLLAGVSRRRLASELAAYLLSNDRLRELDLIVRDIETQLTEQGLAVVDVDTARKLSSSMRQTIITFIETNFGTSQVQLREHLDPQLLGGVRISAASQELDGTIRHRLQQLQAQQL